MGPDEQQAQPGPPVSGLDAIAAALNNFAGAVREHAAAVRELARAEAGDYQSDEGDEPGCDLSGRPLR